MFYLVSFKMFLRRVDVFKSHTDEFEIVMEKIDMCWRVLNNKTLSFKSSLYEH